MAFKHMLGMESGLSGEKSGELRGPRRWTHLLRSTQPIATYIFWGGFKGDNECHNVFLSQNIDIALSCVTLGPVLGWSRASVLL